MNEDTVLFNFRIPADMKSMFEKVCQLRNVSMTSQINTMISEHIKRELLFIRLDDVNERLKNEPLDFISSHDESVYNIHDYFR